MRETTITLVTYRWDAPFGVEAGWYSESYEGDERIDDSQKIWFPVDVDEFDRQQEGELRAALAEAFPGAEIEASDAE